MEYTDASVESTARSPQYFKYGEKIRVNQDWFEMLDVRRKNFSRSVWIPLRAIVQKESNGKYGYEGYKEDFFWQRINSYSYK